MVISARIRTGDPERGLQRNNAQDWWPKMVVLKIMQQYYSATGDERVITFMTNYFKYQLEQYPKIRWTDGRIGENSVEVII